MPTFDTTRIDDSHSKLTLGFASTDQEQEYLRIFPREMPATHRLAYRWIEQSKGPARLTIWPESSVEMPGTVTNAKWTVQLDSLTQSPEIDSARIAELEKLSPDDLLTKAAENGIPTKDGKGKNKSRAALIAAIAHKADKP